MQKYRNIDQNQILNIYIYILREESALLQRDYYHNK